MRKKDRLGPLQMRIPWHHRSGFAAGQADEAQFPLPQKPKQFDDRFAQVQPEIENDLIVAAPPGVQLPADLSDQFR